MVIPPGQRTPQALAAIYLFEPGVFASRRNASLKASAISHKGSFASLRNAFRMTLSSEGCNLKLVTAQ
jgi:hypothetical protein